jgi:hypothetical protein
MLVEFCKYVLRHFAMVFLEICKIHLQSSCFFCPQILQFVGPLLSPSNPSTSAQVQPGPQGEVPHVKEVSKAVSGAEGHRLHVRQHDYFMS